MGSVIEEKKSLFNIKKRLVLAINGGDRSRIKKFPAYETIGQEEEQSVLNVLRSGVLSKFVGSWHGNFYGGPEVKAFEKEWASYFKVKHAVAVNSATSGLYAAVGAIGVSPGDEIIVSPYTMTASAVAPLVYDAIPVFADIEDDCFCLDPISVEKCITPHTKGIIVVDIFGQPYDVDKINAIAKKHSLFVIEDCAQAPGAAYGEKLAGTLGDVGVYSLNYHKHIHCGEGGIVVTNDDNIAERLRMIRNHAEAVVDDRVFETTINMLGFNYRMTELEAAIGRMQLEKLEFLVDSRIKNVKYLEEKLSGIPFLEMPKIRNKSSHVYYVHPIKFNKNIAGVHRDMFVRAVKAELSVTERREEEGVRIGCGYVKPLYLQQIYQKKWVYGTQGYPWNAFEHGNNVNYNEGICPVAEQMYRDVVVTHELMHPGMGIQDLDDIVRAFYKVSENLDELR
jgi:perosamine synthetase